MAAVVIFLQSDAWEARWLGVSTALTAAAMGDEVQLALFAGPLARWASGRFDEGAPASAPAAKVGSLAAMVEEGRRDLGVRLVACDTAVRLAGVEAVRERLDAVAGLPTLWRAAQAGRIVVI